MSRKLKIFIIAFTVIITLIYLANSAVVVKILYPLEYRTVILRESKRNSIDPSLVTAIIFEESRFKPDATSKAGAIGLMQLMPSTAKWAAARIGYKKISEEELYKPDVNIKIGTWYLRYLFDKYKREDLVIAAYNSGHQNVDKWMKDQGAEKDSEGKLKIAFKETRNFVSKVERTKEIYRRTYGKVLF